jgi:hypothetical protein
MAKVPSNHGKEWTATELKKLKQLARQRLPTRVAAKQLGRTLASVAQKASIEGVSFSPKPQLRKPKRKSANT